MTNPQQQSSSVPFAVDRNGELHDTNDIELLAESLVLPLRCADCGAALEAVRAYPRRDGPRIIHVAAHYRLAPGAAHLPTCPWRTDEPLRTPDTRRAAQPQGSSLVYSLVVPGRGHGPMNAWRGRGHRSHRRPAINSASTVASILRRYGEDAANIRLDYRGRSIKWHYFLFTGNDFHSLGQLLLSDRPNHPIAVVGPIGESSIPPSASSHRAELARPLDPPRHLHGPTRIVLRSSNERLLSTFDVGQSVLALGWWRYRHVDQVNSTGEATVWVNQRWQIDAYDM